MVDVVNLQQVVPIDIRALKRSAQKIALGTSEAKGRTFSVAIISDERMIQLNEMFRGKNATTDVLSFPYEPDMFDPDRSNLGDIVISIEQAERQANENDLTLESEIDQLLLHGLLHLCGYDHEADSGEMNARELDLRVKLEI